MPEDSVGPELRAVENAIDRAHLSNPLMGQSRTAGIWYFLAASEEFFVKRSVQTSTGSPLNEAAAFADTLIHLAKWPMRWLTERCSAGGKIPTRIDDDMYSAAMELVDLGHDFGSFESAYSYASWDLLSLELDGASIIPTGPMRDDQRYEAYDRLTDVAAKQEHGIDAVDALGLVEGSVRIDGQRFLYPLGPRTVNPVLESVSPEFERKFALPGEWKLTDYCLADYSAVCRVLWTISAIHFSARITAASRGCFALGYLQALVVMSRRELVSHIVRYTGLPRATVASIVRDLTYGAQGIATPDPALQPLVDVPGGAIAWAPNIILHSSMERNLLVLLNRMSDGRQVYSQLSGQRESLLRATICTQLAGTSLRFWHGDVAEWGDARDVDLAIISDAECQCVLIELKSFFGPADPREIRDKSEEVARGIAQVKARPVDSPNLRRALCRALAVDARCSFQWAVVSENTIGGPWVQDEAVPVVRASHLVAQILREQALAPVCDWLASRQYLPQEGIDFDTVAMDATIDGWTLKWFGLRATTDRYQ